MGENILFATTVVIILCIGVGGIITLKKETPKENLKESKYSMFSRILEDKGFVQNPKVDKFGRITFILKICEELSYKISFHPSGKNAIEVTENDEGKINSFMLDVETEAELRLLLKMLGL